LGGGGKHQGSKRDDQEKNEVKGKRKKEKGKKRERKKGQISDSDLHLPTYNSSLFKKAFEFKNHQT
jgi:hypothetical protein